MAPMSFRFGGGPPKMAPMSAMFGGGIGWTPLKTWCQQHPNDAKSRLEDITKDLIGALSHEHSLGAYHRNLSKGILMDYKNQPFISDDFNREPNVPRYIRNKQKRNIKDLRGLLREIRHQLKEVHQIDTQRQDGFLDELSRAQSKPFLWRMMGYGHHPYFWSERDEACEEAFGPDWTAGIKEGTILANAARTTVYGKKVVLEPGMIANKYQRASGAIPLWLNAYEHFGEYHEEQGLTESQKGRLVSEGLDDFILKAYHSAVNLLPDLYKDEKKDMIETLGWSGIASGPTPSLSILTPLPLLNGCSISPAALPSPPPFPSRPLKLLGSEKISSFRYLTRTLCREHRRGAYHRNLSEGIWMDDRNQLFITNDYIYPEGIEREVSLRDKQREDITALGVRLEEIVGQAGRIDTRQEHAFLHDLSRAQSNPLLWLLLGCGHHPYFWSEAEEFNFMLNYGAFAMDLDEDSHKKWKKACEEAFGPNWTAEIKRNTIMKDAVRTYVVQKTTKLKLGEIANKYRPASGAIQLWRNAYKHFRYYSQKRSLTEDKGRLVSEGLNDFILKAYHSAVNLLTELEEDERNILLEKLGWVGITSGVGGMVDGPVLPGRLSSPLAEESRKRRRD
ncbi:uncharacterized protein LOC116214238 isoform X2 [Punica granatum]|uniref:Uncharacterized protein LOC116214238 isoform X2 n=1 Tax=Punica granatum TaxID=22663 RepID=A0A6P8EF93_PUNGR|nr:uncharacterized protein LOC116214238 isoform X2 [Punica granatum]